MCIDVLNVKECMKDWEDGSYPWDAHAIVCSQDSPYGSAENPYSDLSQETNCKNSIKECYINMLTGVIVSSCFNLCNATIYSQTVGILSVPSLLLFFLL